MHFINNVCVFSKYLCFVLLLLSITSLAQAEDHYYDFVLKETNFTRLCSTKSMLTVNDSFPGPVIQVHKGDTAFVNVHNHGNYGVTLHWHGVKQPRNPWSDGPLYITQCSIEAGTNFTYKVIFSTEEGTLWWHAHSEWTQSSVHGAIIILPAEGTTYPFPKPDAEEVIVLASWYNGDVNEELHEDLLVGADLPRADAYVINGQPGTFFDCPSAETTYHMLVDYGKTYLLRIINAAVNSELFFAVADHNVTVVGMDGSYLKPVNTPFVVISPGQTMNVLLTANRPLGHYYMAARQYVTVGKADIENATAAIIEYRGSYTPPSQPLFPSNLPSHRSIVIANEFLSRLRSLASEEHPINVPLNITTHMFVDVSQKEIACPNASCQSFDGNRLSSAFNNVTFHNPSIDILLAYYRNISGIYTADFPNQPLVFYNFTGTDLDAYKTPTIGTKVKVLNYNETVEIVFQGTDVMLGSVNHPMHLHGYSFYVVGSGVGNFNNQTHPNTYNLVDPPELNTIRVPKRGWVTVRFQANNPGVWLWHCHLTKHLTWGMKTAFIVKNGGTSETSMLDPPTSMPQCSELFISYIEELKDSVGMLTNQV
ncbi:putative laccase-9 [Cornus florida]|uniref:putative laccase-9 n=1 Tax=Cornus florida TaxID=4283 RepID=UPI002899FFA4|nr:putative laccase-9 [Cornus florida]